MTRILEQLQVTAPVELRAAKKGEASPGTLSGYAAKYNVLSRNLGGFVEKVDPGAFTKSLADGVRVMARYNHRDSALLGTTDAETLTLSSDDVGLRYDVLLPDTSVGRDVAVLAKRGDLRFSSFAFYCIDDEWDYTETNMLCRTVKAAKLVDVAPVNDPAYLDSTAAMRSLSKRLDTTVEQVRAMSPGAIRDRLITDGEIPVDEQRATHSSTVSVQQQILLLDQLR